MYNKYIMFISIIITSVVVFVVLVLVSAVRLQRSDISEFELSRRIDGGDRDAKRLLHREGLLDDIATLQRISISLLLVTNAFLWVVTLGWLWGIVITVFIALEYGVVARISMVHKLSQKLYETIEPNLLKNIPKLRSTIRIFKTIKSGTHESYMKLSSRHELQHIIDQSEGVLSEEEKQLIVSGLSFGDQLVSSIMTPSKDIDSIKRSEFLGPLTLDELHKLGHNHLPVIGSSINHIIGILHLQRLLDLDVKRSVTAERAMEQKVFYIHQKQTLLQSLAAFLSTQCSLFIVVNDDRETVGLITLGDVLEALMGRKIIDEFDSHDDIKTVSARKKYKNI